jgi:hypothetical protein
MLVRDMWSIRSGLQQCSKTKIGGLRTIDTWLRTFLSTRLQARRAPASVVPRGSPKAQRGIGYIFPVTSTKPILVANLASLSFFFFLQCLQAFIRVSEQTCFQCLFRSYGVSCVLTIVSEHLCIRCSADQTYSRERWLR